MKFFPKHELKQFEEQMNNLVGDSIDISQNHFEDLVRKLDPVFCFFTELIIRERMMLKIRSIPLFPFWVVLRKDPFP
ncbi:hypothetical protein BC8716_17620 [Shouchella clausii]|nr:hypothetical protein BC8716_17620 [Shouchella clausii]